MCTITKELFRKSTHLIFCGIVISGGVSERPKERASKARVGETQPWVQIPPPPPGDPHKSVATDV